MRDQEIIRLLIERDERGIDELMKQYGSLIRYIIRPVVPDSEDAKECLSDVKNFAVELVKSKYVHKAIIGLIIMGIYIYLFLGNTPFWIGTFITLSALLLFMNWSKPMSIKNIAKFLLISSCGTAAIIIVFEVIFRVPLP